MKDESIIIHFILSIKSVNFIINKDFFIFFYFILKHNYQLIIKLIYFPYFIIDLFYRIYRIYHTFH